LIAARLYTVLTQRRNGDMKHGIVAAADADIVKRLLKAQFSRSHVLVGFVLPILNRVH
jgi:hypothetical protein